jgi:hypothetical protein
MCMALVVAVGTVAIPVLTPLHTARADVLEPRLFVFRVHANYDTPATPRLKSNDCLIVSNNGTDLTPSGWSWAPGGAAGAGHCGFATKADQVANGQSVWIGHPIYTGLENRYMYVLESKVSGKCLVSDTNGDNTRAHLERFAGNGPFCGASESEILQDPRAVWDLFSTGLANAPIRSFKTNACLIFGNRGQDLYASMYRWTTDDATKIYCGLASQDLLGTGQATFALEELD